MELFGLTIPSYSWQTVLGSAISGVFLGAMYALVAVGLTLIYGVCCTSSTRPRGNVDAGAGARL